MKQAKAIVLSVAILTTFLTAPTRSGEEGERLGDRARMLLDYQSFMRGDRDGAVRFALTASREFQRTPLAELAVRLALFYDPSTLSSVNVGEAEARRILAENPEMGPELRDALRRFIARSLAYSGRREEAKELHLRRGLAMTWLIAGPLAGRKAASFESRRLPEAGDIVDRDVIADLPDAALFKEWERKPPWRPLPENRAFPFVRPWRWSGKGDDGSMLMFTGLEVSNADGGAQFHVFAESSWRLFIDGALVAEMDKNVKASATEHMVAYSLAAGKHEVVLQVFPPRAGMRARDARVALRLESASNFSWVRQGGAPVGKEKPSVRREARGLKYLADLRAVMDEGPYVSAAYSVACLEQGLVDEAAWWAERAARADPANFNVQYLAGLLSSLNPLLPEERRRDAAVAWYRSALSRKPDLVPALLFLGEMESAAGHARKASAYIARAYEINPASLDVLMARGDWATRFASGSTARAAWEEAGKTFPNSPAVQVAIASLPSEGFLDMERRLIACRAAAEAGPYIADTGLKLAEALADFGNHQEAEYVLRDALEQFAGDVDVLVSIADIYARMSLFRDAITVMSDAVRLQPDNAALWRKLGDFHMHSGSEEAALALWKVSLAANPGQFQLSDMLGYLEGNIRRFHVSDQYDAIALTASADPAAHSGDVVRLLDRSVLLFQPDGSYRRITHEIDLARTRRGGESLTGLETGGELLTARVVFPNGNTLEPEPYPGNGGLRLPVIIPGAAREIRYLESVSVSSAGKTPIKPWYFQDPRDRLPMLTSEFMVRVPRSLSLSFVVRGFGQNIRYETEEDGDFEVHKWTANLGHPTYEPNAVHVSERIPSVEVGYKTTWDEIAHNELRKLEGRLIPSMRMRALVDTLSQEGVAGKPDPEQLARDIYRYVCDNIDPTPAGEMAAHIHVERMGDRALLLLGLLRAAGFDADPAAARPGIRSMPAPTWELPNRDIFPIPMVRLAIPGGRVYWLDVRYDSLPFGKITDDLSGATLLAFLPGGPLFEPLPSLPAEDSIVYMDKVARLPGAGEERMTVSGRSLRRGASGLARERELAELDAEDRKKSALKALYKVFPDAVLERFEVLRTDDSEASSLERYEIATGHPVEERPDGLRAVSLCFESPNVISEETRNMIVRHTPCHITSVHIAEDRNAFVLPPGASFVRLPEPAQIPSRFGIYQLRVLTRSDNSVEVIRNCHIPAQRIPSWEWEDFLDFLRRIDLAEKQWIEYSCNN